MTLIFLSPLLSPLLSLQSSNLFGLTLHLNLSLCFVFESVQGTNDTLKFVFWDLDLPNWAALETSPFFPLTVGLCMSNCFWSVQAGEAIKRSCRWRWDSRVKGEVALTILDFSKVQVCGLSDLSLKGVVSTHRSQFCAAPFIFVRKTRSTSFCCVQIQLAEGHFGIFFMFWHSVVREEIMAVEAVGGIHNIAQEFRAWEDVEKSAMSVAVRDEASKVIGELEPIRQHFMVSPSLDGITWLLGHSLQVTLVVREARGGLRLVHEHFCREEMAPHCHSTGSH